MDDSWSLVDFSVQQDELELVSDLLWGLGVVAIEERTTSGGAAVLRTSMGDDPRGAIDVVVETFPSVTATVVQVSRSIADTWRQHATATRITDTLSLVPAWLPPDASQDYLLIEPLDTFGLGNHPTTVLALRLALSIARPGSSVFDLGCGSGVLAVGLAKFRNCIVKVFDIAESAHEAVRLNCELNDVHDVTWCEGITGTQSDVVLANILSPVLIAESNAIVSGTHVGGFIVLSGMRDEQVAHVLEHYSQCDEVSQETLEGWTAVVLRRNA